jgi:CBS-domain-containing membrane protein
MARKVVRCRAEDDLDSAAQLMRQDCTRRLPVTDREGHWSVCSRYDLACEASRTLRGVTNDELRNLVLECTCRSIGDACGSIRLLR